MISPSIKGKVLVFAVFFLGIASGMLLTKSWENRAGELKAADRAKQDVNRFYDYLALDEAQRVQMKKITDDIRPEINKIFQQIRPQMDQIEALRKESRNQMRSILSDEQKIKYDEFSEAMRKKQKPKRTN